MHSSLKSRSLKFTDLPWAQLYWISPEPVPPRTLISTFPVNRVPSLVWPVKGMRSVPIKSSAGTKASRSMRGE